MGKSTDPNDQASVKLLCSLFSIYASSAAVLTIIHHSMAKCLQEFAAVDNF